MKTVHGARRLDDRKSLKRSTRASANVDFPEGGGPTMAMIRRLFSVTGGILSRILVHEYLPS